MVQQSYVPIVLAGRVISPTDYKIKVPLSPSMQRGSGINEKDLSGIYNNKNIKNNIYISTYDE